MKLDTKVTTFSAVMSAAMIIIIVAVSFLSFRQFTIASERQHVLSIAGTVEVGLTELMNHDVIKARDSFLRRLTEVEGVKSVHIVRAPSVTQQFGTGLLREVAQDGVEASVIKSGQPFFGISNEAGGMNFRGTIPYVATQSGTPNCMTCHNDKEGTVLGAITVSISMNEMMNSAYQTAAIMVLVIVLFMLVMMLFFRRLLKPVITTARDVQDTVGRAIQGDFHGNIERRTGDEIGQVAEDLNNLLKFIQNGLTTISQDVAQLLQQAPTNKHENLLTSTISRVEGLIDAAHFKQAIEEDETKQEIYQRLSTVLQGRFGIKMFSIYEVTVKTNTMIPLIVDGEPGAACRWCDPQILVRSESCRARRTGHAISSIDSLGVCVSFRPPSDGQHLVHTCIPIMQSGSVGSVLQLVADRNAPAQLNDFLPYINVYLREAAPVIEAKRLMDTLHASTLTDPMTGLHNRRFLEEFSETLVSSNLRRKSQMAILMLDLDYFKMVNDTYGHDAGDLVLKALAKTMQASVRASDLVIRYGGEEFLIIMQESTGQAAEEVAEKIRVAVESMKIQLPGATLQKTISIGIAEFPNDSDTFWQAVKYADVAMYKAKEAGRNQVMRFRKEMWKDELNY
jgi:diguanylate cyclase (GGDEF)-like protein